MIVLLIELIYVVEQLNVLLFSFDEGGDDLVDVVDTGCLHDCLEGLLDDLSVAHVLVKQPFFLDILVLN